MSDKPVAGLVAFVVAAPLVLLCCLGPAVFVGLLAGAAGWFSGLGPLAIGGLVIIGACLAFHLYRRSRQSDQFVD